MNALLRLAAVLVVAAMLAGCSRTSDVAVQQSLNALAPAPTAAAAFVDADDFAEFPAIAEFDTLPKF